MLNWLFDKAVNFLYRNDNDPWMIIDWDKDEEL